MFRLRFPSLYRPLIGLCDDLLTSTEQPVRPPHPPYLPDTHLPLSDLDLDDGTQRKCGMFLRELKFSFVPSTPHHPKQQSTRLPPPHHPKQQSTQLPPPPGLIDWGYLIATDASYKHSQLTGSFTVWSKRVEKGEEEEGEEEKGNEHGKEKGDKQGGDEHGKEKDDKQGGDEHGKEKGTFCFAAQFLLEPYGLDGDIVHRLQEFLVFYAVLMILDIMTTKEIMVDRNKIQNTLFGSDCMSLIKCLQLGQSTPQMPKPFTQQLIDRQLRLIDQLTEKAALIYINYSYYLSLTDELSKENFEKTADIVTVLGAKYIDYVSTKHGPKQQLIRAKKIMKNTKDQKQIARPSGTEKEDSFYKALISKHFELEVEHPPFSKFRLKKR